MRFTKLLFLSLCFCLPVGLFAQASVVGDWTMQVPAEDGGMIDVDVSLKDNDTYTVDFGGDGQIEVKGKYAISGGQITVQNESGDECTEKGVYNFKVTETLLIMNRVEDPCPNRGGPEGLMQFKRK